MTRQPRIKAEDAIYHVIQRGNERKEIFRGDDDKQRYLETLKVQQQKYPFKIYAYCLMDNHIHLLVDANGTDISQFIKGLNISYVYYFNKKHARCGHLFQDRFKSELVDNDSYLIQASKYIHRNPVKAGMVKDAQDYHWSSYSIYMGQKDYMHLLDSSKILDMISHERDKAAEMYRDLVSSDEQIDLSQRRFMDMEEEYNTPDEDLISHLIENASNRDDAIIALKNHTELSYRQIAKYMGDLSISTIHRVLKKCD